jgi:hypothetical protein
VTHGSRVQQRQRAAGGGSSQLLALDQATGATVWGPIVISDAASAAYDGGTLFVIGGPFSTAATIRRSIRVPGRVCGVHLE